MDSILDNRILNALVIALLLGYVTERLWIRKGPPKTIFADHLTSQLREKHLRTGRWIFRLVFLVVFSLHLIWTWIDPY
jgi:hypothetical protein